MVASLIKTTGELREFIANQMIAIRDGKVKPEDARNIILGGKLIVDTFYAEDRVLRSRLAAAGEAIRPLGSLPIAEPSEAARVETRRFGDAAAIAAQERAALPKA